MLNNSLEFRLLSSKNRKVRIYVFYNVSIRKKIQSPLPILINPSFWNDKNQRVISSYKHASKINEALKIVEIQLLKSGELENLKDNKSFRKIIQVISSKYLLNNSLRIKSTIERHIELAPQKKNRKTGSIGLKQNTIDRFKFLKKVYEKFENEKGVILFINDFSIQDIDLFTTYLLHEKKYGIGTVGKHLALLKTIFNRAKRDGYPVSENLQFID